jgi:3-dehydroquinate synthase
VVTDTKTLPVGAQYTIEIGPIGEGHFENLRQQAYAGWVVITDTNTRRDCLPLIKDLLRGVPIVYITIAAGEQHKTLDTCQEIWKGLFRGGVGRRWCCLNLGGGVVGDMGGFAAATFKRGIDFVQIPTTLLSQVDASVGGKLGIDFFHVKNSIGVFRDPVAVWIDPRFLRTLPERERLSGYAEMLKHALIADRKQWEQLTAQDVWQPANWTATIAASVAIKREIVLADPYERGLRKALNFGHTIGHAVESHFLDRGGEGQLTHGEAIAVGMICEAYLSREAGALAPSQAEGIVDYLLRIFQLPPVPEQIFDRLIELMRQDKKNDTAAINFTFLAGIGSARVNATATVEEILRSLRYYNSVRDSL